MAAMLAGAATLAIAPALASADTSPLTDDSTANFAAGTLDASQWAVDPGSIRQKLATNFDFNGTAGTLPTGLTATQWTPMSGTAQLDGNGHLVVDGDRVDDGQAPALTAPRTMEFRGTFSNTQYEHIGFGTDLLDGPWALFSTGDGSTLPVGLYGRTLTAAGGPPAVAMDGSNLAPAINPLLPHTYRIDWGTADVKFYVDDVLVATHTTTIAGPMRFVISDPSQDSTPVSLDWLTVGAPTTGTFTSRVLKSDNAKSAWGALTSVGSGVTIQTRSGNTAAPDASWSSFQPLGAGGAIASPHAQYIQYQATLAGSGAHLDNVSIPYTADTGSAGGSGGSGSGGSGATTGTGQSSGGQGTKVADTSAPRVTFSVKSLRASKKGTIGVKVGCPATETSCKITIDLKRGKSVVAHKTVTVAGGKTKDVTLQLNKASRRQLGKAHTLKVSALITARDAAGNTKSSTKKLTLRG